MELGRRMISRMCFPFFDSRFARALAKGGDYQLAPRWLLERRPRRTLAWAVLEELLSISRRFPTPVPTLLT